MRRLQIAGSVTGTLTTLYFDTELQTMSGESTNYYQGDGTSGLYIWGASVSRQSWTYVPTTAPTASALPQLTDRRSRWRNVASWEPKDDNCSPAGHTIVGASFKKDIVREQSWAPFASRLTAASPKEEGSHAGPSFCASPLALSYHI